VELGDMDGPKSTNGGPPAEEIALLNCKIEELEKENKDLRETIAYYSVIDKQAKEQGALEFAEWIGDRRYNSLITPARLVQLWKKESQK
jgi:hypothetical protein